MGEIYGWAICGNKKNNRMNESGNKGNGWFRWGRTPGWTRFKYNIQTFIRSVRDARKGIKQMDKFADNHIIFGEDGGFKVFGEKGWIHYGASGITRSDGYSVSWYSGGNEESKDKRNKAVDNPIESSINNISFKTKVKIFEDQVYSLICASDIPILVLEAIMKDLHRDVEAIAQGYLTKKELLEKIRTEREKSDNASTNNEEISLWTCGGGTI